MVSWRPRPLRWIHWLFSVGILGTALKLRFVGLAPQKKSCQCLDHRPLAAPYVIGQRPKSPFSLATGFLLTLLIITTNATTTNPLCVIT